MNFSILKIIKVIIIIAEVAIVIVAFVLMGLLLSKGGDIDMSWSNLGLLPHDPDILKNYDDVALTFKDYPELKPQLLITETKIKLENTSLFVTPTVLIGLLLFVLSLFALEQLRRMIKTVAMGNPFIISNVWRIYSLGILFILIPLINKMAYGILNAWVRSNFEFDGLILHPFSMNNFPWILTGLLFFTIGRIMSEGINLKKEQDLTI
ncbi:MAG: DUF2975 domain-containing protein [Cyclobacteriaceae bacterium]|nr:DUF2975 domain-containing protein [Cyclobacteriaceae bacterium HetDA_MAG_MS6]